MQPKVIFMHGLSQDEALAAMRAVKAALKGAQDIAFSMSTPTNLEWKVSELVEEVGREHAMMREGEGK
jgi:hypothetical protein